MKEIRKLTNAEMENIAGGSFSGFCGTGVVVCAVSAVGCKVGNWVCRVMANNALKRGDQETFCKLNGNANACSIAAGSFMGGACLCFMGAFLAPALQSGGKK